MLELRDHPKVSNAVKVSAFERWFRQARRDGIEPDAKAGHARRRAVGGRDADGLQ
jgi:hypothetical protein